MLHRSLGDWLHLDLNRLALEALAWRDFGNGLRMARLGREGRQELVLYWLAADAQSDAFQCHEHLGGEMYLVLMGRIADETGEYGPGEFVFLDARSAHTPWAVGETLVLVFWPEGVRLIEAPESSTGRRGATRSE